MEPLQVDYWHVVVYTTLVMTLTHLWSSWRLRHPGYPAEAASDSTLLVTATTPPLERPCGDAQPHWKHAATTTLWTDASGPIPRKMVYAALNSNATDRMHRWTHLSMRELWNERKLEHDALRSHGRVCLRADCEYCVHSDFDELISEHHGLVCLLCQDGMQKKLHGTILLRPGDERICAMPILSMEACVPCWTMRSSCVGTL